MRPVRTPGWNRAADAQRALEEGGEGRDRDSHTAPTIWAAGGIGVVKRLIGATLVTVVLLDWARIRPRHLVGRAWGVGAGVLAGVAGGAVGTPGPPVILYSTTQGWSPRTIKANLQAFFFVNQVVTLAGYWWAGLLSVEVLLVGT